MSPLPQCTTIVECIYLILQHLCRCIVCNGDFLPIMCIVLTAIFVSCRSDSAGGHSDHPWPAGVHRRHQLQRQLHADGGGGAEDGRGRVLPAGRHPRPWTVSRASGSPAQPQAPAGPGQTHPGPAHSAHPGSTGEGKAPLRGLSHCSFVGEACVEECTHISKRFECFVQCSVQVCAVFLMTYTDPFLMVSSPCVFV